MEHSSDKVQPLCSLGLCRGRAGSLKPRAGSFSAIGSRNTNDDLVFAGEHCRMYVVLDGIGGHAGGGVASRVVLDQLRVRIESMCASADNDVLQQLEDAVAEAISRATQKMRRIAFKTADFDKMGTVFALAYLTNDSLLYTHVGDARIYLMRDGDVRQLTRDQTYVQLMVDAGILKPEDVPDHPMRNLILNAVGTHRTRNSAAVETMQLQAGDVLLLTTDGVSDPFSTDQLGELLRVPGQPADIAENIVQAALTAGSNDNASCVVVQIEGGPKKLGHDDRDKLHQEVEKLHELLGNVEAVDEGVRADLRQIADDIRGALQAEQGGELQSIRQRLSDRALEFETHHPHLTSIVASIVNLLSGIGI